MLFSNSTLMIKLKDMKKLMIILLAVAACALGASATILFPIFDSVAGGLYEDGTDPDFEAAGIKGIMKRSTGTPYFPSTFEQCESFCKDVMPDDVVKTVVREGENKIIMYQSRDIPNDLIVTQGMDTRIYIMRLPDGKFKSVYYEKPFPINQ